jgi:hypothetical protein
MKGIIGFVISISSSLPSCQIFPRQEASTFFNLAISNPSTTMKNYEVSCVLILAAQCFAWSTWPIKAGPDAPLLVTRQNELGECRLNYTTDIWTWCEDVLAQFDITLDDFIDDNPSLSDGCAGFQPGETYCVGRCKSLRATHELKE